MGLCNKILFSIVLICFLSCHANHQHEKRHRPHQKVPIIIYVPGNSESKIKLGHSKSILRNRHLVTVYYEALCPDSENFIVNQLEPTIRLMQDYVNLKLVPFGKAHSVRGGESFICQHGPPECRGNKIQDCVLHNMQFRSDADKVEYVVCEMTTRAASRGSYQCVQDPMAAVRCVDSQQGTRLQLNSEALTNSVRPTFVPTVTIDGVFNQAEQNMAMKDLKGLLCSRLGDVPPCRYHSRSANSLRNFTEMVVNIDDGPIDIKVIHTFN